VSTQKVPVIPVFCSYVSGTISGVRNVLDWTFSIRALQDSEIPWVQRRHISKFGGRKTGKLVVCTASLARNNSDIKDMVYVHARVVA
jgi:hypothetical protein